MVKKYQDSIHIGSLMTLCHIKNYQLHKSKWSYKGRIVFRGDCVKDEHGAHAVFSEQGTSASHLMAARFVYALAHMPGMDGEDSDATGAYTQIDLGPDCPPTHILLPRNRWPSHWKGQYEQPLVRLTSNLYGHPLAGLYWGQHCDKVAMQQCGFQRVIGWECLL